MKVAVYHNLPSGGAVRVIEEYLRHTKSDCRLVLPSTANRQFADLGNLAETVELVPIPEGIGLLDRYRQLLAVRRYGRDIAAAIDRLNCDAVLCGASVITQAPEILPHLKTPSAYFCPEPLRGVYDRQFRSRSPKAILKRMLFKPYDWSRASFDWKAIHQADAVITNSKFTAGRLKETYGVDSTVIYAGVDTKVFRPSSRPRRRFVLSLGALHPLKGHQFVIESLATLPVEQRPGLVVIGDRGDYADMLHEQAAQAGVHLTIKQQVPTAEVVKYYAAAGVVAAAQYQEPFGLVPLEAMACRTPVVAVKEGGLVESVTDGRTGLLVPRDPQKFGQAIHRILSDSALAEHLGQHGRQEAETKWRWKATAEQTDQVLASVAG